MMEAIQPAGVSMATLPMAACHNGAMKWWRWSITLGVTVTPQQVALCMIDLKLARLAHDPHYADGPIDVIGYAALIPEIIRGSRS